MDENISSVPQPPPVSSAMTRMANVFMSPGELYTEVAAAPPQTSSWLLPFLLTIVLGFVSTFAVYNNPSLRQQVFDMQEKSMQQMVTSGRITQDQMDRQMDGMKNSGPVMFVVFGGGFQAVGVCALFFLGALLLWVASKVVLKFPGGYSKILEILGLASWIAVLGTVITLIMISLMNNLFASPSGALFLGESFDPVNKAHKLLAALNIFTLWEMGVLGFGLSRISGKSPGMGMAVSFAVWALFTVGISMIF
jgi:hypothetical protein